MRPVKNAIKKNVNGSVAVKKQEKHYSCVTAVSDMVVFIFLRQNHHLIISKIPSSRSPHFEKK